MPEIIDYLSLPVAQCWYFDANTGGVASVTATSPVGNKYLYNAAGNHRFLAGDSVRVISLGIILPEAFTFYKDTYPFPSMTVLPEGVTSGHDYFNPNFSAGHQFIIGENFQQVTDAFLACKDSYDLIVPANNLNTENFILKLSHAYFTPKISMFGVDTAMNGVRFYITPFVQVAHSFPLV